MELSTLTINDNTTFFKKGIKIKSCSNSFFYLLLGGGIDVPIDMWPLRSGGGNYSQGIGSCNYKVGKQIRPCFEGFTLSYFELCSGTCFPLCLWFCDLELHPWQLFLSRILSLKIAAVSTSFCSWRVYRVTSTCIGGKGALEHRCSIENAGGVAFFGAPESNWNMPLLVHHRNYTIFVIYHVAWIVCKVSLAWNVHIVSISIGLVKELIELTVGSWMSHPFTHECLVGRWWKEGEVNGRIGGGSGLVSRTH